MAETLARRILVTGRVQGVGFRPFVSRIANGHGLAGWVRNRSGEVEIHVEGSAEGLAEFTADLTGRAPPLARPEPPRTEPAEPAGHSGFAILESAEGDTADIHLPPDHFVCGDCLAEMADPAERRYRYPFINCTQCGPRYTIIDRLPYDRPNTAMAGFELCPACRAQYNDPLDRRYHAQPLACPECGPRLCFRQPGVADAEGNEAALNACLAALRSGAVVAVKGVGGYHLVCDAADEATVRRLRDRKRRPHKPLAVLVPWAGLDGLDRVRVLAEPTPAEQELLCSPLRPIVLTSRRADSRLAPSVAPGLGEVGLMLPYSPLHQLLAEGFGAPLVATSANLSGEPVLTEAMEVEARLGHVADAFLHHDRPIRRPADDSVFRRIAGQPRPLRLGRGSAPVERKLPFALPEPLLAAGSDLKNTVVLAFGERVVVSPHIGDLGSVRGGEIFERTISDLARLYGIEPRRIVCDAHPDYFSTRWALTRGLPVEQVFHHHAHASGLAAEWSIEGDLLVFAWDGTGYGEDGTVWGGEMLLGRPGAWRRVGSLRPFRLPGGDRAGREPWRCAAALCWEADFRWPGAPKEAALLRQAWERRINSPVASSAGRLFDAAAALLGLLQTSTHEGQGGMAVEAAAGPGGEAVPLPLARNAAGLWLIDWEPLLPALSNTSRSVGERAALFHASLAEAIAGQAERARDEFGVGRVGLTGGVFQNRRLAESALAALERRGFRAFLPRDIPVNDAGLGFGQIVEAVARQRAWPFP
jgi:hydrogenase maturation protein HypF